MIKDKIILPLGTKLDWQYSTKRKGELQSLFNGVPFDGFVKETWGDGKLYAEVQYIQGYREGLIYTYTLENKVCSVSGSLFGAEHGRWRYYDKNGRLESEKLVFLKMIIEEWVHPIDDEPYLYYDFRESNEKKSEISAYLKRYNNIPLPSIHLQLEEAFVWFEENDLFDSPLLPGEFEAAQKAGYLFVSPDIRESLGFWKPS